MSKRIIRAISCILIVAFFSLSIGCASTKGEYDKNYVAYLQAYKDHTASQKQEIQLFKLTAVEGQTIEMKGVKEFSVSMPAPTAPVPQQAVQKENEWARVAEKALTVGGAVLGYQILGHTITSVASTIANNAGHNVVGSFNDQSSGNFRNFTGDGNGATTLTDVANDKSSGTFRGNTGDGYGTTDNHSVNDSNNPNNSVNNSYNPPNNSVNNSNNPIDNTQQNATLP